MTLQARHAYVCVIAKTDSDSGLKEAEFRRGPETGRQFAPAIGVASRRWPPFARVPVLPTAYFERKHGRSNGADDA